MNYSFVRLMAVIFITTIFSCNTSSKLTSVNKEKTQTVEKYIEHFEKNGFDVKKVYFPKKVDERDKYFFYKKYLSNDYYYYYGTFYFNGESIAFKDNKGKFKGCNQVLFSLQNEDKYSYDSLSNEKYEDLLFAYDDSLKISLKKSDKKTIVLVYNYAAKKIFFKDIRPIVDFVKNNKEYDLIVLSTDFL